MLTSKELKGKFIKGQPDGLIEKWYENGRNVSKINFSKGKLNGLYQEFSNSGFLNLECTYKNDILNGEHTKWYSKNIKQKVLQYANGNIMSEKNWNKDGTVRPETSTGIVGVWKYRRGSEEYYPIFTLKKNGQCSFYIKLVNETYTGTYTTTKNGVRFNFNNMPHYRSVMKDVWNITYLSDKEIKYDIVERKGRNIRFANRKGELVRVK
ncbi:MAG: hypothetical protein L3J08_09605 [Flavobacteriaceae bacterium]|nr:hypothetical protein [Flavobacteriaceae bacterium]